MKYFVVPVLVSLVLLGSSVANAAPTSREINRVEAATRVFEQMPGKLPASVLDNAKGIAVIPGELKGGFIFGGEIGGGVLVSRLTDGSWSPPAFISVAGGSFGLQVGGETRDIILVFNTARSMDFIENGKVNLGGDASVAAGPLGADMGVTSDIPEVYSYASDFGAFIGAAVEGTVLSFDSDANRDMYGIADPLKMQATVIPEPARRFSCVVAGATGAPAEMCS
ncbi:MAG: lipid-binding SYLF domain-containing protein [Syntrophobacteraceae bacterium]|jgi:lipid-binding SYLF domain-containing protein